MMPSTQPIIVAITMLAVVLAATAVFLIAQAVKRHRAGTFTIGRDMATIQCQTCLCMAATAMPAGVSHIREHMAEHYRKNPDHGIPLEIIPAGWAS